MPVKDFRSSKSTSPAKTFQRKQRSINEGNFAWQAKSVTRFIRNAFEATHDVASALALYHGLTEIASDVGAEMFTRRITEIATYGGLRYRKTEALLKRFEQLGLISVRTNLLPGTKSRFPNTYTLLHFSAEDKPSCIECATSGTEDFRFLPKGIKERKQLKELSPQSEVWSNEDSSLLTPPEAEATVPLAFPAELDQQPRFAEIWANFQAHRRQPCHGKGASGVFDKPLLDTLGQRPLEAVAALELAIGRNWRGFRWEWYDKRVGRPSLRRAMIPLATKISQPDYSKTTF